LPVYFSGRHGASLLMPTQKALIFRYILVVAKIRCIIRLFCIGFTTELYDGMNLKYPICIG
jgi:hypothetical protein